MDLADMERRIKVLEERMRSHGKQHAPGHYDSIGTIFPWNFVPWSTITNDNGKKPEDEATKGATWGTNISGKPVRFGDATAGAGLYLLGAYLGYYDGSDWTAYINNLGQFYFSKDADNYIKWDGTNLVISGGGGGIKLTHLGLYCAVADGAYADTSRIRFLYGTTEYGGLGAKRDAGIYEADMVFSTNSLAATNTVKNRVISPTGQYSEWFAAVVNDSVNGPKLDLYKSGAAGYAAILNNGLILGGAGVLADIAEGALKITNQFTSTLATGTKPLAVTSTTKCDNLNADKWDSQDYTDWTDWTPTVYQGEDRSITIPEAKYCLVGKVCHIYAMLAITEAGAAGTPIEIRGIPTAAVCAEPAGMIVGTGWYYDSDASVIYIGACQFNTTGANHFRIQTSGVISGVGATPNIATGDGDTIRIHATYRIA